MNERKWGVKEKPGGMSSSTRVYMYYRQESWPGCPTAQVLLRTSWCIPPHAIVISPNVTLSEVENTALSDSILMLCGKRHSILGPWSTTRVLRWYLAEVAVAVFPTPPDVRLRFVQTKSSPSLASRHA